MANSTADDLSAAYEKLYDARTKWREIGMQLKLDKDTLQCIDSETESHDHNSKCLRKMLTHRLEAVQCPLTWEMLCDCLRANTVGRNDVAEKIEQWMDMSIDGFQCPCKNELSDGSKLLSLFHSMDLQQEESYPILDLTLEDEESLSSFQRTVEQEEILEDKKDLQRKTGNLHNTLRQVLSTIPDITHFLSDYLDESISDYSFNAIYSKIKLSCCTLLNVDTVRQICESVNISDKGALKKVQKAFDDYDRSLHTMLKRRILAFPGGLRVGESGDKQPEIKIKLETASLTLDIGSIKSIKITLQKILNIQPQVRLKLLQAKSGCIEIVFAVFTVPAAASLNLFPTELNLQQRRDLALHSISLLEYKPQSRVLYCSCMLSNKQDLLKDMIRVRKEYHKAIRDDKIESYGQTKISSIEGDQISMKSKEMQQEYLRQISQLQAENEHLCTLNSQLQSSVDQLHAKKQEQVSRFEELITLYQQQLVDQRREIEGLSNQLKSLELQPQETPQPRGVDELGQSGTSVEKVSTRGLVQLGISYLDQPIVLHVAKSRKVDEVVHKAAEAFGVPPDGLKFLYHGVEITGDMLVGDALSQAGKFTTIQLIKGKKISEEMSNTPYYQPKQTDCIYAYCMSCENLVVVREIFICPKCGKNQFKRTSTEPLDHFAHYISPDLLKGHCTLCGGEICQARVEFECVSCVGQLQHKVAPLRQVRENIHNLPCMNCGEIRELIFRMACSSGHTLCTDCFCKYCQLMFNADKFKNFKDMGYSVHCPGPGDDCPYTPVPDPGHFQLVNEDQSDFYKKFIDKSVGVITPADLNIICTQCMIEIDVTHTDSLKLAVTDDDSPVSAQLRSNPKRLGTDSPPLLRIPKKTSCKKCSQAYCIVCKQVWHDGDCLPLNKNIGKEKEVVRQYHHNIFCTHCKKEIYLPKQQSDSGSSGSLSVTVTGLIWYRKLATPYQIQKIFCHQCGRPYCTRCKQAWHEGDCPLPDTHKESSFPINPVKAQQSCWPIAN